MGTKPKKKKKNCKHLSLDSKFPLTRYVKSKTDDTLHHYAGDLTVSCKDCGEDLQFVGMPKLNAAGTAITLFLVPANRQQTLTNAKKNGK